MRREALSARLILKTLGLRKGGVEVVSCPTCGRTQIDLIHLANQVEDMVSGMDLDVKVAVMGCDDVGSQIMFIKRHLAMIRKFDGERLR